jgi:hypothetical protein
MGAWNSKPFGNDTAGDWLGELEKAKDESVIQSALEAVLGSEGIPDAPACDEAVAAATVVEAARRQPLGKLPPEARQWVSEHGFVPADSLVKQAIAVIKRIVGESELRELWLESKSSAKWQKQMELLLAGLQEVQASPSPERKPKAPAAPRLLDKLVEKVNPDEESPLRKKLRQKLEAIEDVNAPIAGTWFKPPLNLVAARGLIPEATRLVERGAMINPVLADPLNGSTPLEEACANGRTDMAEWLLARGAHIYVQRTMDVCLGGSKVGPRTFAVPRAVYAAVRSGSIAAIELLVRHGARLIHQDLEEEFGRYHIFHETLLHKAVEAGHVQVIEFLVKNGVPLEALNSPGETAFYCAAVRWQRQAMLKLIALGANPNAKNAEGETALDFLEGPAPAKEIAAFLRQLGGRKAEEL